MDGVIQWLLQVKKIPFYCCKFIVEEGCVYLTGRGNFGQQGYEKQEDSIGFHKIDFPQVILPKRFFKNPEECQDKESNFWIRSMPCYH